MATSGDLLGKIKGIFFVEDDNSSAKTTTNSTTSSTPSTPAAPPTPAFTPPPTIGSGSVNEKIFDSLSQALANNNAEGFDYFEFRGSLLSLSKMPMDEQTRFQSAYAMAQTMGATTSKLIDTAGGYLNVLKNEELKFQQALDNQKSGSLVAKEQEIKQLEAIIGQKAEQIKKLTEEIQQHQTQIETTKQQVTEMSAKAETAKNDFQVTYNSLVSQIQMDIANMQKYLK